MRLGEHFHSIAGSQAALDAGADVLTFRPAAPVRIVRWGATISVALDTTQDLIAKLDHTTHDQTGSATRSDGSGGQNLTVAADQVVGAVVYAEPSSEIIVRPGDFVTIQVTQAATAGDGFPFIEYQQLPFDTEGLTAKFSDDATSRVTDGSTAI